MAVGRNLVSPHSDNTLLDLRTVTPPGEITAKNELEDYFRAVDDKSNSHGKPYDSYFEAVVADGLRRTGVEFRHAKWSAFLRRAGKDPFLDEGKYVPDFITKLMFGDRIVVIEPHGARCFNDQCYKKYEAFVKERGDKLYFIIITDMPEETLLFNLNIRHINKIADEVWHVPSYSNNPIGKKGGRKMNEPAEDDVNEILGRLREFRLRAMRRGAGIVG
jgi:hypothetical protein